MGSGLSHISFLRIPVKCYPFPLAREGAPLNWRPSADAVAGNGWDGGRGRDRFRVPLLVSPPPSTPPSRVTESAHTDPLIDYLTDVPRRLPWQNTTVAREGLL